MALADLIARLERDAEARLTELTAKTDAEATRLLADAARARETHRDRELALRRAARRARHQREQAEARQHARADRLRAQHALLERIFARARLLLPELAASPAWRAALPRHLAHALRYLEGQRVVVKCAPAVVELVRAHLGHRDDVVVLEEPTLALGCQAMTPDESVLIDDTLGARLARAEARLAVELIAEVTS